MDRGEWEEGDSAGAGVGEEVLGAGGVGIKKRIGDGGHRGPGGTTWSCVILSSRDKPWPKGKLVEIQARALHRCISTHIGIRPKEWYIHGIYMVYTWYIHDTPMGVHVLAVAVRTPLK